MSEENTVDSFFRKFWASPHTFNRATRRRMGYGGHGSLAPIDLGIKQYKREHGNDYKRVLYFKQQMWTAFRELRNGDNDARKSKPKSKRTAKRGK